jgi:hypothetical protein
MRLTPCKTCGKPVAKSAEACPHCGAYRKRHTSLMTWIVTGIIGVPLIIGIVSGFLLSGPK